MKKAVLIPLILMLVCVVLWMCMPEQFVFAHVVKWRKEVKVKVFVVDGANVTGKLTVNYIKGLIKGANKILDDGVTAEGIPGGSHIKLVWDPKDPKQFGKINDPWPPPGGPGQEGDICEDLMDRTDPVTGKKVVNTRDGKYDEDWDLHEKVKSSPNCTHGLSIVFVRDFVNAAGQSTGTNGITYTPECNPLGLTKLKQCVSAETLAHELMHAMGGIRHGLSQQATKDINCDGVVNASDRGWDANGDGDITKEDKEYLLWGRQRGTVADCGRTGTKITTAQHDKLVNGADKIPCTQNITDPPPTPTPCWTKKYPSYGALVIDVINDTFDSSTGFNVTGFDYIDILTSEARIYFDPKYDRLSLYTSVLDTIPLNMTLMYGFMLNTDNNNATGYLGSEFAAILHINATEATAALYKYIGALWEKVATLDWLITNIYEEVEVAIGVEDWTRFLGDLVRIDVPLGYLNLTYHGVMPVVTFAEDVNASVLDRSSLMSVPLEIVFPPVVCLGQTEVKPGTTVPGYGCEFTPETSVKITFDDIEVATAYTDDQGYFAVDLEIPEELPPGDYFVYATDAYGKSDITTLTVTSPVGGVWVLVDKFVLLAPYIALASTILVATAATTIYAKRRKKKQ